MWNGTDEILKPKPTSRSASPIVSSESRPVEAPIRSRFVVPVAPYTRAIPYRKKALAKAPSRKYFIAASPEARRARKYPAST